MTDISHLVLGLATRSNDRGDKERPNQSSKQIRDLSGGREISGGVTMCFQRGRERAEQEQRWRQ